MSWTRAKHRVYLRNWRKQNPEKREGHKYRRYHLKRLYGLTEEQYENMLRAQGGLCAVCRGGPGKKRYAVDHDHSTGKPRALLCINCNLAIGHADESPSRLRDLATYLEAHGA